MSRIIWLSWKIVGLPDTSVKEAKHSSGTSITAKFAKQQGKKILCIPSNLDTTSVETEMLIQDGAKLVLSPNDVLLELGITELQDQYLEEQEIQVSEEYKEVYSALSKIPTNVNEIRIDVIEVYKRQGKFKVNHIKNAITEKTKK